ncbi:sugar ABC transporter permease [Niallia sp. 03133]|uniref:sugar ABC transporter permease n=1 Tax=Niallia sp. 03133 TaxID=3458060 RepID=UPI004044ACD3
MKKTKSFLDISFSYLTLIIVAVICIYPALWVILSSFRPGTSLFSETLIPAHFTFDHYVTLFKQYPFGQWYYNTIKISVISTFFGTLFTLITGYIFSVFRFSGRKNLMNTLLVLHVFPGFMSMIAIYILLSQMNLLNTHTALICVYVAGAPLWFLFSKTYFDTMPKSVIEAARIDGAGHLRIFTQIILPMSKPLIVFTSLMTFNTAFTDFIFSKLILRSPEQKTLAVGLFDMINDKVAGQLPFTLFAAGCVMVALPVTLLFMFMQRYLIDGLTAGADKG